MTRPLLGPQKESSKQLPGRVPNLEKRALKGKHGALKGPLDHVPLARTLFQVLCLGEQYVYLKGNQQDGRIKLVCFFFLPLSMT